MTTTVKCPRCGAPAPLKGNAWRPFCCERCKLLDLGAWADGRYAIPGEEIDPEDEPGDDGMDQPGGRILH